SRFRTGRGSPRAVQRPSVLLHHLPHDFGRICRRVLILLGCLAFEEHVLLRMPARSAVKSLRLLSCRDQPQAEGSHVRMPFENRTAHTTTATTMEPTIASHSVYGAVSGISFPNDSRIAPPLRA